MVQEIITVPQSTSLRDRLRDRLEKKFKEKLSERDELEENSNVE